MIRVYSDLNCPFCFVLHERLIKMSVCDLFHWRLIEHAPNLASEANTRDQQDQLAQETELARQRAPDINLTKPDFCVNSRLATLSYLAVEAAYPKFAPAYLASLYRAYWQHQQDISHYEVLVALLQGLGLSWLDPDDSVEQHQLAYQREWQSKDFDDRIPALQSTDDRVMLGLQNSYNIINFANGITQQLPALAETCLYSGHQRLALYGVAEPVRNELEQIPDFICEVFADLPSLLTAADEAEIDAIVISVAHQATEALTRLRDGLPKDKPLPIIFIGMPEQQHLEAVVFDLGASDFIAQQAGFGSFRARVNHRISTHKALALLTRQAHIDELTGLSNRRSFEQHIEREWRQGCRYQLTLAVVILDCDDFKAYNDNYGHFAGDECLRRLADSLATQVHRPSDVIARLGGEEFVLLLPNTKAQDALLIAERARQDIADLQLPHTVRSGSIVTISCGVATTVPHADQTPLALMEEADKALYQAKANGRNRCVERTLHPPEFTRKAVSLLNIQSC